MRSFLAVVITAFSVVRDVNAEAMPQPPEITHAPSPKIVAELMKRQNGLPGLNTCGFLSGQAGEHLLPYFRSCKMLILRKMVQLHVPIICRAVMTLSTAGLDVVLQLQL
jgi:hypothetical protein